MAPHAAQTSLVPGRDGWVVGAGFEARLEQLGELRNALAEEHAVALAALRKEVDRLEVENEQLLRLGPSAVPRAGHGEPPWNPGPKPPPADDWPSEEEKAGRGATFAASVAAELPPAPAPEEGGGRATTARAVARAVHAVSPSWQEVGNVAGARVSTATQGTSMGRLSQASSAWNRKLLKSRSRLISEQRQEDEIMKGATSLTSKRDSAVRSTKRSPASSGPRESYETYSEIEGLRVLFDHLDEGRQGLVSAEQIAALVQASVQEVSIDLINEVLVAAWHVVNNRRGAGGWAETPFATEHIEADFHIFATMMLDERLAEELSAHKMAGLYEVRDALSVAMLDIEAEQLRLSKKATIASFNLTDGLVALMILLNALGMALAMDLETDWLGWDVVEYFFLFFFLGELFLRIMKHKWKFLCGKEWTWNVFDTIIVALAVLDSATALQDEVHKSNQNSFGGITLIRLARLGRLARLVRLLRFRVFKELRLMVLGVFAGLRVLFWAIVLLFFIIFMLGLLMRQTVGETSEDDEVQGAFKSVPWAMFTIFRCLTDSCDANADGRVLPILLMEEYGALFFIFYTLTVLFVIIGIFNLIMAVFLENVMTSTRQRQKDERHTENLRVTRTLNALLVRITSAKRAAPHPSWLKSVCSRLVPASLWRDMQGERYTGDITVSQEVVRNFRINREAFDILINDPEVERILDDLEISMADRADLFDVLDADASGELEVGEITRGLLKLRGQAEKSDVVACLLVLRHLQSMFMDFQNRVLNHQAEVGGFLATGQLGAVSMSANLGANSFPVSVGSIGGGSIGRVREPEKLSLRDFEAWPDIQKRSSAPSHQDFDAWPDVQKPSSTPSPQTLVAPAQPASELHRDCLEVDTISEVATTTNMV